MPSFFYLQFPPQEHYGYSEEHHARGERTKGRWYLINQTNRTKKLTGYIEGETSNNPRKNSCSHRHTS